MQCYITLRVFTRPLGSTSTYVCDAHSGCRQPKASVQADWASQGFKSFAPAPWKSHTLRVTVGLGPTAPWPWPPCPPWARDHGPDPAPPARRRARARPRIGSPACGDPRAVPGRAPAVVRCRARPTAPANAPPLRAVEGDDALAKLMPIRSSVGAPDRSPAAGTPSGCLGPT